MEVLKIVLTVVYIIVSLALVILVLMQEGKSAGLGSISGAAERCARDPARAWTQS